MNDLLNIIITTYDKGDNRRYTLLEETVWSLLLKLRYDHVHYIVTDDSEPDVFDINYSRLSSHFISENASFEIINTNRHGVGFAKNNALKLAFQTSPFVLLMEDDWMLKEPFYIQKHIDVLSEHSDIGMVRFGYLGGTFNASYVDYGDFKYYWKLHRGSGVYIYSGQVSLRHERFYQGMGWHTEGISPGEEELDMCKRFNGCENCGDVLWPAEYGTTLNAGPFVNIGLTDSTNGVVPE